MIKTGLVLLSCALLTSCGTKFNTVANDKQLINGLGNAAITVNCFVANAANQKRSAGILLNGLNTVSFNSDADLGGNIGADNTNVKAVVSGLENRDWVIAGNLEKNNPILNVDAHGWSFPGVFPGSYDSNFITSVVPHINAAGVIVQPGPVVPYPYLGGPGGPMSSPEGEDQEDDGRAIEGHGDQYSIFDQPCFQGPGGSFNLKGWIFIYLMIFTFLVFLVGVSYVGDRGLSRLNGIYGVIILIICIMGYFLFVPAAFFVGWLYVSVFC